MDWQPIETAPKDGGDVLIYIAKAGEQMVAFWNRKLGGWQFAVTHGGSAIYTKNATHWMPLPAPPESN